MKTIQVDGATLAYEDSGRSHGPAVLLLNALGTDHGLWAEQCAALQRSFRVLRFDARGHGKSTLDGAAPANWSLDTLVQDACAVLDAAGVERAHWCGVSLGGMVAMHAATQQPQRVARLVLANTAAALPPADMWQSRIDAVRRDGLGAIADGAAARWFTPDFIASKPERVEQVQAMVRACDAGAYAACCAVIRDMDERTRLPQITAPTLVIGATRDPSTPLEHSELLLELIPGADLLVLDASHLSCIEQAEDFSGALLDFLRT